MIETTENKNRLCAFCGKEVIDTGNGIVHVNGGQALQLCQNCGWTGGGVELLTQCVRCGDSTSLIEDHKAS